MCKIESMQINFEIYTLWTGMGILAWFLVGGNATYSHTWFLYIPGLLRYQGPPGKLKKAEFLGRNGPNKAKKS